jgi:hypothetical protein
VLQHGSQLANVPLSAVWVESTPQLAQHLDYTGSGEFNAMHQPLMMVATDS